MAKDDVILAYFSGLSLDREETIAVNRATESGIDKHVTGDDVDRAGQEPCGDVVPMSDWGRMIASLLMSCDVSAFPIACLV